MEINNQMLEETRDTVTVPAQCVVQILRVMARGSQERDRSHAQQAAANNPAVPVANAANEAESESEEEWERCLPIFASVFVNDEIGVEFYSFDEGPHDLSI